MVFSSLSSTFSLSQAPKGLIVNTRGGVLGEVVEHVLRQLDGK